MFVREKSEKKKRPVDKTTEVVPAAQLYLVEFFVAIVRKLKTTNTVSSSKD